MADTFVANPGVGGNTFASDDIGGVHYPRSKIVIGADNTNDGDVSSANPLPITAATLEAATKLEDAVHTTGDRGVHVLGVRLDADTSPVSADSDYHPFVFNSTGRLKVSVKPGATVATTGNITAAAQSVAIDVSREAGVNVQIAGTFAGLNATFEGSIDGGTTYFTVQAARSSTGALESTTGVIAANPGYVWEVSTNGYTNFRVRSTAFTSGTAAVTITPAAFASEVAPSVSLQTGANTIGAVNIAAAQTLATVTTVATVTNITNQGHLADNAAFVDGTTRLMMAGFVFDETAGTALTENDGAAARVDSKRAVVHVIEDATTRGQRQAVNASGGASVTPVPHTAGGLSKAKILSAASTNATSVKASAGQLYGWALFNSSATAKFVKLHNTAGTPTAGASVDFTILVPPGSGANVEFSHGIPYATGIGYTITGAAADADTTAVAANDVLGILLYK
jgi:hypothetical protein